MVPQIKDLIGRARLLVPQERIHERVVQPRVFDRVPQKTTELVEAIQLVPREPSHRRIVPHERIVDGPLVHEFVGFVRFWPMKKCAYVRLGLVCLHGRSCTFAHNITQLCSDAETEELQAPAFGGRRGPCCGARVRSLILCKASFGCLETKFNFSQDTVSQRVFSMHFQMSNKLTSDCLPLLLVLKLFLPRLAQGGMKFLNSVQP